MKGTETQKPPPLLLVLEAEEEGKLRLASLSLTFKVTAWLPLLLTSLPWLALDTRKEKIRESRKSKERKLLSFGKEPQQSNCFLLVQKGPKRMGEREKRTFFI